MLLKDIGEQGILQRLQKFCPSDMIGDDGAVLTIAPKHQLVVTTDMLVDGVHFSDRTTSPEDVGWRSVAANLSDLAAMGALPLGITVGLSLPGDVAVDWIESLYRGMQQCLESYQTVILGGDVCRSSLITVSITALGQVLPNRVISRFVARPGDVILVTGTHGGSRAGLELLLNPEIGDFLDFKTRHVLMQKHQRPQPRLDVVEFLGKINHDNYLLAGMDSSDGLADAIVQICRCSKVGAIIDSRAISFLPELGIFVSDEKALDYALYGGEDFELVLGLPQNLAENLLTYLDQDARIIGKITEDQTIRLVDSQGIWTETTLTLSKSFQHFGSLIN
jgi:thiamine-monophosphate kinase